MKNNWPVKKLGKILRKMNFLNYPKKNNIEQVDKKELERGINLCIDNIQHLLESATTMLNQRKTNHSYVFWSFAVEEYGKVLRLFENEKSIQSNKVEIYKTNLFIGRQAHEYKFTKGIEKLKCVDGILRKQVFIRQNYSSKVNTIKLRNNSAVSVIPSTTGWFEDTANMDTLTEKISDKLRDKLVYVDLKDGLFQSPKVLFGSVKGNKIVGEKELSSSMMESLIRCLDQNLNEFKTTRFK